jgi:hypothetical protein
MMFNHREEYKRIFTARAELMKLRGPHKAVLAAYDALIDELSNDLEFRAEIVMEVE